VKEVLLFCKKAAKNFLIWVRGVSLPKPLAQIKKVFVPLFSKSGFFRLRISLELDGPAGKAGEHRRRCKRRS
jgi:hypothetical protein